MLDDLGHSAVEAHSGAGLRIDLSITDYSMPGMNGAALVGGVRDTLPAGR